MKDTSQTDRNLAIDLGKSSESGSESDPYPGFPKVGSPQRSEFNHHSADEVIPPSHEHRTLVLCFDGTGDQFDDDNSNVVNFFSLLKKDDPSQQLVYYQAGIGTYNIPQVAKPMMAKLSRAVDSMIGIHLNAHVMGGYEFLMQNYHVGDRICIFGFSRGAYTARALAGMIHKVGLLPKSNDQQVPFAYKMYSREDEIGWRQSTAFKKAFSIDVDIFLLGVWDTVGSVGVIPKRLPFTTSNTHVKHFRHALAIDERRVRFNPKLWTRPTEDELKLGTQPGDMPKSRSRSKTMKDFEREYTGDGNHFTDVEEVWFSGCHCDVGGGAVKNEVRNNLARIPLRWMIRQCFKLNTGIMFHREAFKQVGMDPTTLWPKLMERPPPVTFLASSPQSGHISEISTGTTRTLTENGFPNEEEEDYLDATSPVNDMLKISKSWWFLELIPQKVKFQKDDDSWVLKLSLHRGRARIIPKQHQNGVKIHRTVKLRMEAENLDGKNGKYVPRAKLHVEPTWVG
ncbi:hypothetical protein BDN72DRAFT_871607 [Pluteus cervinus]|uniref:Uncharacterized protein n=1 Tax=Pluteus cervinus TaxID=181527 RepID=A0ACD3AKS0_9AGAR|nr:hypothetical protein BDN72DRAFT_871607 [Pluteus cervinus]